MRALLPLVLAVAALTRVIAIVLAGGLALGIDAAAAQTTSPVTATTTVTTTAGATTSVLPVRTPSSDGPFSRLSPGNQKIVRALYAAQTSRSTRMTLDQIAALKAKDKGWGKVFQDMKAQGLVTQKNLGQVVSQYSRHHSTSHTTTITTASNRTISSRSDDGARHTVVDRDTRGRFGSDDAAGRAGAFVDSGALGGRSGGSSDGFGGHGFSSHGGGRAR